MTHRKYYLCEGKLPQTIIADYLKKQIRAESYLAAVGNEQKPLDGAELSLEGFKVEKRNGTEYTHLLINGSLKNMAGIESHIIDSNHAILGMKNTAYNSLPELVDSYLPKKPDRIITKLGNSVKRTWRYNPSLRALALIGTMGTMVFGGATLGSHLNQYLTIKNQEILAESRMKLKTKEEMIQKIDNLEQMIKKYQQDQTQKPIAEGD